MKSLCFKYQDISSGVRTEHTLSIDLLFNCSTIKKQTADVDNIASNVWLFLYQRRSRAAHGA